MADERLKAASVLGDLVESLIVDVATEAHRAARLGLDYRLNMEEEEELRLSAHARAIVGDSGNVGLENGNKHTVDVFGQTHPTIASEMFECINCGRPIVAGRFAPHLEKCMGKGRKARLKANRNINMPQQQLRSRRSPKSLNAFSASGAVSAIRQKTTEDTQRIGADASDESHDDSDKDLSYGLKCPGKARSRKRYGGVWKNQDCFAQTSPSVLVPVPLQVSPVRSGSAVSVGSLSEADPNSSVAGITVEVAIEQFRPCVTGKVPTSGDMVFSKGGKEKVGQHHVKGRRVVEKRKHMGQVLAGSSSVLQPNRANQKGATDFSKESDVERISSSPSYLPYERAYSQNGVGIRGSSDSINDDGQAQLDSKTKRKSFDTEVSRHSATHMAGYVVIENPRDIVTLGVGNQGEMSGAGDQSRESTADFSKRKKRPRDMGKHMLSRDTDT